MGGGRITYRLLSAGISNHVVLFMLIAFSMQGCVETQRPEPESGVLMEIGDSVLHISDLESRIPMGISPEDSIALLGKMAQNWIKGIVLQNIAKEKLPDYEEIEELVEHYRNRLIAGRYLQMMQAGKDHSVLTDSVRTFYNSHRGEMLTERPLVKGIYVKMPSGASSLPDVKRCVFSGTEAAVDEFEKNWMGETLQYDYFAEDWTDWENVAEQIPYRFHDPDAFLNAMTNFETEYNGSTYLLHITAYLPSGSELPFEFAAPRIKSILEQAVMAEYEESLVKTLIRKAISDHKLQIKGYDPITGEFVRTEEEKRETEI